MRDNNEAATVAATGEKVAGAERIIEHEDGRWTATVGGLTATSYPIVGRFRYLLFPAAHMSGPCLIKEKDGKGIFLLARTEHEAEDADTLVNCLGSFLKEWKILRREERALVFFLVKRRDAARQAQMLRYYRELTPQGKALALAFLRELSTLPPGDDGAAVMARFEAQWREHLRPGGPLSAANRDVSPVEEALQREG